MKITIEHESTAVTVDTKEVTATEVLRAFCGAMKAAGWRERSVEDALWELSEECSIIAPGTSSEEP